MSWQWQLTGTIDQSVDAQMFDVDLFDTPAATVSSLHAAGRRVVCYVSAGTFEDWRPDASRFPASVKGSTVSGFQDERWLDIRQWSVLQPILEARMDLCVSKGFDAIELDNVDGYANGSGFPLTAADQLTFNRNLASSAHGRHLSVALKNDIDQTSDLVGQFDWALNEQCFEYGECSALQPFVRAHKAVFNVEYNLATSSFCPQAKSLGFSSMRKHLSLDAYRVPCP
ncbi:MAG TPA: endo alpha-1,4 polygalactosaminidase [Polyangia bacterium]|nr:endo alpha-1,4 polygalactosaminidase [Polyangia bacterium]